MLSHLMKEMPLLLTWGLFNSISFFSFFFLYYYSLFRCKHVELNKDFDNVDVEWLFTNLFAKETKLYFDK